MTALTALTRAELEDLHTSVLAERDRRRRVEHAPEAIATAVGDAARVGIPEVDIREAVDTALEIT